MKLKTLLIVVLAIELNARGSTGLIAEAPLNTVTEGGRQAIFNCTSDTYLQNWIFSAKREEVQAYTGQNIVLNCVVQPLFTTQYEVVRPGGNSNQCNLIVKSTTVQQAGVYTCTDTVAGTSAILTVIDRDPSIIVINSSGVVAGDNVTMSYTVRYNTATASTQTPTIQPVLTWTDSDGNIISSSNTPGTNSITSIISITAERQTMRPYTCSISYKISWPPPSTGLSFANNTPNSVSTPPRTPTIDVSYAPVIQSLKKSEKVSICRSDAVTITCNASANPPATYSWIYTRNYSGATITAADMNGVYACIASNVIQGSIRSDTNEITLNVSENSCEIASKNDTKGNSGDSLSAAAIVLGLLLALSVAANIATFIVIMRNRSKPETGITKARASNIAQRNEAEQVQTELQEPHLPSIYQELSPTREQSTIYAQLS